MFHVVIWGFAQVITTKIGIIIIKIDYHVVAVNKDNKTM